MARRSQAIFGVVIMSALLMLYFYYAGIRAFALFKTGTPLTITMGIALLVLPLIGLWALIREIVFGFTATKLVDTLEREGLLPEDAIAAEGTSKPLKEEAQEALQKYRDAADSQDTSWQTWLRLGIMLDLAGDRSAARAATRKAIRLNQTSKG